MPWCWPSADVCRARHGRRAPGFSKETSQLSSQQSDPRGELIIHGKRSGTRCRSSPSLLLVVAQAEQAFYEGKLCEILPKTSLGCLLTYLSFYHVGDRWMCNTGGTGMCLPFSSPPSQLSPSLPPAQHVCTWVCVSLVVVHLFLNLQKPPSC